MCLLEDVQVMTPEETGLEHTVLVVRNPADDGWDVIKHLD